MRRTDELPRCNICGEEKEWTECYYCDGMGEYDETDTDPLEGDQFALCPECAGRGGWWACPNAEEHFKEAQRTKRVAELAETKGE